MAGQKDAVVIVTSNASVSVASCDADFDVFRSLASSRQKVQRGRVLRMQGSPSPEMYFVHDGWLASSVTVIDGGRQIVSIHTPNDLIGFSSAQRATAFDQIHALSDAIVSVIKPVVLNGIFERRPRLAQYLMLKSQQDHISLMTRLVSVGRTDAIARVSALICELVERHVNAGGDRHDTIAVPIRQPDIAELTGLTAVHVNRMLRQLRERGIADWQSGVIRVRDPAALAALAGIQRESSRSTSWSAQMADRSSGFEA